MSLSIELILAYIILIPFIIANIIFAFGSLFQKKTVKFLHKALKVDEGFNDSQNKKFNYINFVIWITIGVINVFNLDNPISLGAIFVFLAFRSGIILSKRFIFGIHDLKIMKLHLSHSKITKIISRAVKISIIIELMFLLSWGILYKYLSISVKSTFGIEVNILVLILWVVGFLYGIIFSVIQSSYSKGFLLKNEIGIVLLLSGEIIKEKVKKKKFLPKFFKQ